MYSTWLLLIITSVITIKRQQQTTWHALLFDTSIFIPFVLPLLLSLGCLWHIVPHLPWIIIPPPPSRFMLYEFLEADRNLWMCVLLLWRATCCIMSEVGKDQSVCTFAVSLKAVFHNRDVVCSNVMGSCDPCKETLLFIQVLSIFKPSSN